MPTVPPSMTAEDVVKLGQKCLEQVPVVVLGSGASAQYGIGGMAALQDYLLKHVTPTGSAETDSWSKFTEELKKTKDLEAALHAVSLPAALESRVIHATRKMVLEGDLLVQQRMADGKADFALSSLIKYLFRSTHREIQIVTTNYDRLAEYACDAACIPHFTGFLGGYYRSYQSSAPPRGAFGNAVADILKVHGSLDWFMNPEQTVVSLSDSVTIPHDFAPVMVTPGTGKYAVTHDEPFRTIITRSDNAFAHARAILCVGYGFNDRHIQPKLMNRIVKEKVPLVILARSLTPKTREFVKQCKHQHFVALENSGTGSKAYTCDFPDGVDVKEPLWEFGTFLDKTIGKQ